MARDKRRRCAVDRCVRSALLDLPLPDGSTLDLGVCKEHHDAIENDPAAWRITTIVTQHSERVAVVPM